MDVKDISLRIRAAFEGPPPPQISEVLHLLSAFPKQPPAGDLNASPDVGATVNALEAELFDIYENIVEHSSKLHLEAFLSILITLSPVLPSSSVITWFDYLRPALKDPRLNREITNGIRAFILGALKDSTHSIESRSRDFRKRIFELYLLDASSGRLPEDTIEELSQDDDEKERRRVWKENLEFILLADAADHPMDFFALVNASFVAHRSARLHLASLLGSFLSLKPSTPIISALVSGPFLKSFLTSLLVDNSTTLFHTEVLALTMALPQLAIRARSKLIEILPTLLAILARALCWKQKKPPNTPENEIDSPDYQDDGIKRAQKLASKAIFLVGNDQSGHTLLDLDEVKIRPELEWKRLESSQANSVSRVDPDTSLFFTFVYGLFPCNTIAFLRRPILYLEDHQVESPFSVPWVEVLDVDELRSRSAALIRIHSFHASVLYRDAPSELTDPPAWCRGDSDESDVARIVAQCTHLDQRNHALPDEGLQLSGIEPSEDFDTRGSFAEQRRGAIRRLSPRSDDSWRSTPKARTDRLLHPVNLFLPSDALSLSAGGDLHDNEVPGVSAADIPLPPDLPSSRGSPRSSPRGSPRGSPSTLNAPLPPLPAHPSPLSLTSRLPSVFESEPNSPHSSPQKTPALLESPAVPEETISVLQREVFLLRNSLNFELWVKKQLNSHVERLHHDRIVMKGEEHERQSLHNRLRAYKSDLLSAQRQVKDLRNEAVAFKGSHGRWIADLQAKLSTFRKEKVNWTQEALRLRGEVNDAKAMFKAQQQILAEAQQKVFDLSNQVTEQAPKVERIADYERQIDRLTRKIILWDDGAEMRGFKEDKRNIDETNHMLETQKLLVGSLEHANQELQRQIQRQHVEMSRLETKLTASLAAARPAPRSPTLRSASPASPRIRHLSVSSNPPLDVPPTPISVVSERLSKLQARYSMLEIKNKELAEVLEEQEGLIEMLKEDLKQAKLRRMMPETRKSSSGYVGGLGPSGLSRPSPVLSALDMDALSAAAEDGFRLNR